MVDAQKAFEEHCKDKGTTWVKLRRDKVTGEFELGHTICCFEAGKQSIDTTQLRIEGGQRWRDMQLPQELRKERLRLFERAQDEFKLKIGDFNPALANKVNVDEYNAWIDKVLVRVFKK